MTEERHFMTCREQLRREGKAYPKSDCEDCEEFLFRGCKHTRKKIEALEINEKLTQRQFNMFMDKIESYATEREWESFSRKSFVRDIVFFIGVSLGSENNSNGYLKSIEILKEVFEL